MKLLVAERVNRILPRRLSRRVDAKHDTRESCDTEREHDSRKRKPERPRDTCGVIDAKVRQPGKRCPADNTDDAAD